MSDGRCPTVSANPDIHVHLNSQNKSPGKCILLTAKEDAVGL
jgi:hypothetical protein